MLYFSNFLMISGAVCWMAVVVYLVTRFVIGPTPMLSEDAKDRILQIVSLEEIGAVELRERLIEENFITLKHTFGFYEAMREMERARQVEHTDEEEFVDGAVVKKRVYYRRW